MLPIILTLLAVTFSQTYVTCQDVGTTINADVTTSQVSFMINGQWEVAQYNETIDDSTSYTYTVPDNTPDVTLSGIRIDNVTYAIEPIEQTRCIPQPQPQTHMLFLPLIFH